MTQHQSVEESIQAFRQAEKWLFSLITDPKGERYFQEKSMEVRMTEFREQIERMGSFLELIGSPQNSFPSIHVAGTSGKGSVVQMLASILRANGLKTGYHVSPYLQVCLEKLIVDGKLIRPSEFAGLVAEFRAEFEAWTAHSERFDAIKYGEAWVALTFKWMAKQQVDWAVIETGLGGRFDPTNMLQPRLAVITNVNYDHVEVLGETLAEIAWHKAGIIKPGAPAVTGEANPQVLAVLQQEADQHGVRLYRRSQDYDYHVKPDGTLTVDGPRHTYSELTLAARGSFQYQNAALAVASLDLLAAEGQLDLDPEAVRQGLGVQVAGRFEVIQHDPVVILDGAHNQHKAQALADSLAAAYPSKQLTVVLGTLSIKDFSGIIKALAPITGKWVATQPKVFGKPAAPASALAEVIRQVTPEVEVHEFEQVRMAIESVLAEADEEEVIVVTGSLYMLGEARGVWRSVDQILRDLEQTGTSALI